MDIVSIVIVENNEGYYTASLRFTDRFYDLELAATSKYMIYRIIENKVRFICRGLYG